MVYHSLFQQNDKICYAKKTALNAECNSTKKVVMLIQNSFEIQLQK